MTNIALELNVFILLVCFQAECFDNSAAMWYFVCVSSNMLSILVNKSGRRIVLTLTDIVYVSMINYQ